MTVSQVSSRFQPVSASLRFLLLAIALIGFGPSAASAQDLHSHDAAQESTAGQSIEQGPLLRAAREATARFQDVKQAEREQYHLEFGCVTGDDSGAMGLHYVNDGLVGLGVVDISKPQIILYEPQPDGSLKLTGADYLVLADAWDAAHPGVQPQLMGQFFHYFDAPNRFGLPAFYTLHVWAWKQNPKGAFVNWHPAISCQTFNGTTTR